MLENTVNKIIINGIKKYSSRHETTPNKTQIRVYYDENFDVCYAISVDYKPKEKIKFKDILTTNLLANQMESLASPVFYKSLDFFSDKFEIPKEDVSVFIVYIKEKVSLCVFNKYKHVHIQSLSSHLKDLGF